MPDLNETQKAFLRDAHLAVVTTLRADGSPHSTVVWIDCDGDDVLFNTARGRAKERHLLADPRVSVVTVDGDDFHRWLTVDGRATLVDEGADEHIDMLAVRYQGPGAVRISGRGRAARDRARPPGAHRARGPATDHRSKNRYDRAASLRRLPGEPYCMTQEQTATAVTRDGNAPLELQRHYIDGAFRESRAGGDVRDAQPGDQRGRSRVAADGQRGRRRRRRRRRAARVRRGAWPRLKAAERAGVAAPHRDADPRARRRVHRASRCSTSACRSRRCAASRRARRRTSTTTPASSPSCTAARSRSATSSSTTRSTSRSASPG